MPARHLVLNAATHAVPRPFRAFAVRSDEPAYAWAARAPWGSVQRVVATWLDTQGLADLAAAARASAPQPTFSDVQYARTSLPGLAAAAPGAADIAAGIVATLGVTGVLGDVPAAYRATLDTRIDFLACQGAGFHNDVGRHWSRCLFWLLALEVDDVEFVMPHAGLRLPLAPGDLLVFDPAMAHGLCRPRDAGMAVEDSFGEGPAGRQMFLTGELPLSDAQWAALGCPWAPVEQHAARGALDLMVAEFDERSGAIKRVGAMRDCMSRATCHCGLDGD